MGRHCFLLGQVSRFQERLRIEFKRERDDPAVTTYEGHGRKRITGNGEIDVVSCTDHRRERHEAETGSAPRANENRSEVGPSVVIVRGVLVDSNPPSLDFAVDASSTLACILSFLNQRKKPNLDVIKGGDPNAG